MNSFNHNTRQNDSSTIVAGQMREPGLGFLGSRDGFPLGMALGGGVTVELILTLSSGGLAVRWEHSVASSPEEGKSRRCLESRRQLPGEGWKGGQDGLESGSAR